MFEAPNECRHFVHKKIGGFLARKVVPLVASFIPGGRTALDVGGAVLGFAGGPVIPQRVIRRGRAGSVTPVTLPPTPTITTPAEVSLGVDFQAVQGAFGLPAMAPRAETRIHLDCPKGMVLGSDNLCYPKAVLRRNNQFRKWRSGPRPPVSAADAKALRRLDAARTAVAKLAKSADLKVTKKK